MKTEAIVLIYKYYCFAFLYSEGKKEPELTVNVLYTTCRMTDCVKCSDIVLFFSTSFSHSPSLPLPSFSKLSHSPFHFSVVLFSFSFLFLSLGWIKLLPAETVRHRVSNKRQGSWIDLPQWRTSTAHTVSSCRVSVGCLRFVVARGKKNIYIFIKESKTDTQRFGWMDEAF